MQTESPLEPSPEDQPTSPENGNDLEEAKRKSRKFFAAASAKASEFKRGLSQRANAAAEKVAKTCSDWTGRETTAADVKKATAVGAVIGSFMAIGPLASVAMRQARAAQASARHQQGALGQAAGEGSPSGEGMTNSDQVFPSGPDMDHTQAIEQDAVEYDQMQYDQLQDHIESQHQLDDVIDDQISYNDAMDFDCGSFDM